MHFSPSSLFGLFIAAFPLTSSSFFWIDDDLNLTKIEDVVTGHNDLYMVSDLPYRTDFGFVWLGVQSEKGTSLAGATFTWYGLFLEEDEDADNALVHGVFLPEHSGVVTVRVAMQTGEIIFLESRLPIMTGCWMNTVFWEAEAGPDIYGNQWPDFLIAWQPTTSSITFAVNQTVCGTVRVVGGTCGCHIYSGGILANFAPPEACRLPPEFHSTIFWVAQVEDEMLFVFKTYERLLHPHRSSLSLIDAD